MTAIETIKKMIDEGIIQEEQIPLGTLRYEGRAKSFLKKYTREENRSEEDKAYKKLVAISGALDNILAYNANVGEGHVGDFLDGLAGIACDQQIDTRKLWAEAEELG